VIFGLIANISEGLPVSDFAFSSFTQPASARTWITAYIGGVKDVRAVDRWMAGGELYGHAEARLRFAYQVVRTLREYDSPGVVQAWLTGVNPELGDRVPCAC
jgi:hypothetical protein